MTKINPYNYFFPTGYHQFHKKQLFNFQLNRPYSWGYADFDDLKSVGNRIHDFNDWKTEMTRLADSALSKGRLINSAFYYRAAEFYTFSDDPDKEILYDKFSELFYQAIEGDSYEKINVPYRNAFLPTLRLKTGIVKRGTIIVHGGFDSFIEEFYSIMKYFSNLGYEVIGFDGCGQGAALRKYRLTWDIEWEKPVKAILDYFELSDVTLFGLSMGGWLCLRASSFEPRIKRVIADGHAIDYMECYPYLIRVLHLWFMRQKRFEGFINKMAIKKAEAKNAQGWITKQSMYITGIDNPMKAFEKVWLAMNKENIHSERVTQDVLLLSGKNDHFIPIRMHEKQIQALTNAKSVTDRIFTKEEHAQNHCQIGNVGLALDYISKWIEEKSSG
jgi:pimeloyl-ACP methyl ester carboxylesterase